MSAYQHEGFDADLYHSVSNNSLGHVSLEFSK